ncbi:hypothetical protein JM946_29485 [Steroidobacter sp. S1-65]|uniref:Capsular biosynthesis protein n=1 Tax=Steroidobacter gossypii TaxID=2805490 RepID=A0ABS1X6N5_9GAMM|nr:hypothetical protein [Steroidobacter gossypii]MBM0108884.1 hypothetical protein [Steroidobacter gossypii]
MDSLVVLVPNWAGLSPDMQAETGAKYASFIQLGGAPLYKRIISQYRSDDHSVRMVFLLSPDAPELDIDPAERLSIEAVRLNESGSIGETVLAGITRITPGDVVVVHMADTLLDVEEMPLGDAVYVQSRSDLYRWTSVTVDAAGTVKITNDRQEVEPCGPRLVCVGLFSFRDGKRLATELLRAVELSSPKREPFFVALESYSAIRPMGLRAAKRWLDCGHVDGYYESRLSYQNVRHFNSLSYDALRGRVTKKSRNTDDFRKQVRWFKQVPDEVAPFLPRVFDSSDGDDPFITMELLSIPTLSDLFVNQRLNLGAWNDVVRSVSCIQSYFAGKAVRSSLAPQLAQAVYFDKTQSRLAEFTAQLPATKHYFVYRGAERWSIDRVQRTLASFVERSGLLNIKELTPIHGDFCFSNLLYDPKVRLIKMIDPRGEFGVPGVFGDRRYDLAKLAHSYAGGYDFVVSDVFSVEVNSQGALHVGLRSCDYHTRVRSIFDAVLLPEAELRGQVYALQALLFLSMLPLHVDMPKRQLAILTIGLQLYAKSWDGGTDG